MLVEKHLEGRIDIKKDQEIKWRENGILRIAQPRSQV